MESDHKKPEIKFKPLNQGLGFHPFSEGLPYTPISKKYPPTSRGTGAVSAGVPKFVRQVNTAPKPYIPKSPLQPPQSQPQSQPQKIISKIEFTFGIGYLFKRVSAYIIDMGANFLLGLGVLYFIFWRQKLDLDTLMTPGLVLISTVFWSTSFLLLFNWALVTAQEVAFGTSLGKKLFSLYLQGKPGTIFWRACFFLISVLFCGMGLAWALFRQNKRCWHDIAVDLQPTEIARF